MLHFKRPAMLSTLLAVAMIGYLPVHDAEAKGPIYDCGFLGICLDNTFAITLSAALIAGASFGLVIYAIIRNAQHIGKEYLRAISNIAGYSMAIVPIAFGLYLMFAPTVIHYPPNTPFPFANEYVYFVGGQYDIGPYSYDREPDPVHMAWLNPFWVVWSMIFYFGVIAMVVLTSKKILTKAHLTKHLSPI